MKFFENNKVPLFFDGAMGTMLQSRGISSVPAALNLTNPEVVIGIHKEYIASGADIITANTFSANKIRYENYREIIAAGVQLAKQAVAESARECLVALDIGSTGKFLKPTGDLDFEECYEIYKSSILAGVSAGADLIIIETMFDVYEAKAAILAAKENTSLPIICTMTFDQAGRLMTGGTIAVMTAVLEGLNVDCIGVNCGLGPAQIMPLQKELNRLASRAVLIQPNAGLPKTDGEAVIYDVTPEIFAEEMRTILLNGSHMLGGCCGTTPEHISKTKELCTGLKMPELGEGACRYIACSYSRAVDVREQLAFGKFINYRTDSTVLKAAKEKDIDYFVDAALNEVDEEADVINLNLGDNTYLAEIVVGIQEFTGVPISIQLEDDSPETCRALDKMLRLYNGKAIINLGKGLNMTAFEDVVGKYGGVFITEQKYG